MKKDQFSNDKLFYFGDRLIEVMAGKIVSPVVYELSLSGKCNCKCNYCCCKNFHSGRMLSRQEIKRIAVEVAANHGEAVTITGGGEPLMNPEFAYCLQQLASRKISAGVITNGLLLDEACTNAIARYASFCRISLDTVDEDLYCSLRGTSLDRNSLRQALTKLVARRDFYKSKLLIGAQIVYGNQSDEDVEQTILFCRDCKLDFLQIRPVDNVTGEQFVPQYEFYRSKREFLNRMSTRYSMEHFSVIINKNKFEEYDTGNVGKNYQKCLGGNFTAAIGHDMRVYFCCSNIGNPELIIGNLKTDSLKSILSSLRRCSLINHPRWEFCQQQCRNHKINKILQKMTVLPLEQTEEIIRKKRREPRPLHCEFL